MENAMEYGFGGFKNHNFSRVLKGRGTQLISKEFPRGLDLPLACEHGMPVPSD